MATKKAKAANTTKRGRGRPSFIPWEKAEWEKTDSEIAHELGCTVPSVFNKRKALIAKARGQRKAYGIYRCKAKPYTRAAHVVAMASNK